MMEEFQKGFIIELPRKGKYIRLFISDPFKATKPERLPERSLECHRSLKTSRVAMQRARVRAKNTTKRAYNKHKRENVQITTFSSQAWNGTGTLKTFDVIAPTSKYCFMASRVFPSTEKIRRKLLEKCSIWQ